MRKVWTAAASAALNPLNSTMIAVALPDIRAAFGVSAESVTQWLVTGYLIAGIVTQSPGGRLGDMWGHRKILALGRVLFLAGSILAVAMHDYASVVASRLLMAVGGALVVPNAMGLLRNSAAPEQRMRVFGMFGAVMGLAAAIGPMLGGALSTQWGWLSIFWVNVPIVAVLFVADLFGERIEEPRERSKFDLLGAVLLGGGLVGFIAGWWHAGLAMLLLFGAWELRTPVPVVDLRLFARREFAAGTAIVGLQNLGMYAIIFQLPFLFELRGIKEHSEVGLALLVLTLSMVAMGPVGGRLAEKVGARALSVFGSLVAAFGVWKLSDVGAIVSAASVMPWMAFMGAGLGLSSGPSQGSAISSVPKEQSGMASGAMSTVRYVGGVAGTAILAAVLAGATEPLARHRTAILIFLGSFVASAVVSLALPGRLAQVNKTDGQKC